MTEILRVPSVGGPEVGANATTATLTLLGEKDVRRVFDLIQFDTEHFTRVHEPVVEQCATLPDTHAWVTGTRAIDIIWPETKFGIWVEGVLVGCTGYRTSNRRTTAEIWYWIGKEHTGNGYAATAVCMLREHLFRDGYTLLEARVRPDNPASLRTLAKVGFRRRGNEGAYQKYVSRAGEVGHYALSAG